MEDSELREVYSADNIQEAHLVRSSLAAVGIEARVVGDHLQNAIGDLPAMAIAPRVWVRAENFDQARKVIADHHARRQSSAPPSIGWKCAECDEANEASFEICWNCQAAYGDPE